MKSKISSVCYFAAATIIQGFLPILVAAAFSERGYFTFGIEWIGLPLSVILFYIGIVKTAVNKEQEIATANLRRRKALKRFVAKFLRVENNGRGKEENGTVR